jgi:arachidonate 5-lipoxygenase
MWFNNADAQYQESVTHLGFTHRTMEGFAVSMNRNLSISHPVYKLLAPHFLYLMAVNVAANDLITEGGWIDQLMSMGRLGAFKLIRARLATWSFEDTNFPDDLKRRGVDDPQVLPHYHFRDDGMLLYNVIKDYVSNYLKIYYDSEDKLTADWEIQAFAAELVKPRPGGCGFEGIPGNGKLDKVEQLTTIITAVIHTSSVVHAATNFPQYEEYGFPPNAPVLLKGPVPTDKTEVTEAQMLKAQPDRPQTLSIMSLVKILAEQTTNSLGDFDTQFIYDDRALKVVQKFRQDLVAAGLEIERRNKNRLFPYPYLLPERIPNSIAN